MKYQYFYQTKENENRSGWIQARDRADAYTRLRKQGLRPYRIKGEDPIRWQPWAIGGVIAALALALAGVLVLGGRGADRLPVRRQQLTGDRSLISAGLANGWRDVFTTNLDRYLSAYAQPGWIALPPELTDGEIAALAEQLGTPLAYGEGEASEIRLLRNIVAKMREEMATYLANGGSLADYLRFLEDRQDEERDFRNQALDRIARAPESMREAYRLNVNARLREMGLAEVGP
ncbi:MAG: hypothetical protein ACI4R9_07515 [Kiritimatiellia bacterium]